MRNLQRLVVTFIIKNASNVKLAESIWIAITVKEEVCCIATIVIREVVALKVLHWELDQAK